MNRAAEFAARDRGEDRPARGVVRQHLRRHRVQRRVPPEHGGEHVGRAQQLGQSLVRLVVDDAGRRQAAVARFRLDVARARTFRAHDELGVGPRSDPGAQLQQALGIVLQAQRARVEEHEAAVETETGSSAGSPWAARASR